MFTLQPHETFAQDTSLSSNRTYVWVHAGWGTGSLKDRGGFVETIALNLLTENGLFKARYCIAEPVLKNVFDPASVSELGLMYGTGWKGDWFHVWMSGGPSLVTVTKTNESVKQAGFSLQIDGVLKVMTALGFGLSTFGTLTDRASFAGIVVSVHLGQL